MPVIKAHTEETVNEMAYEVSGKLIKIKQNDEPNVISDKDYEMLKNNPSFKLAIDNGNITVEESETDTAPLTPTVTPPDEDDTP